jgi:hypothetical protein
MTFDDEARLIEKLRAIEALHAGASTEGEAAAAEAAKARILARLAELAATDPPVEFKFTLADSWSRRLLVALLRRYEIRPYRYKRQRYTTVMARVPTRFVDETLWPQYEQLNSILRAHLERVTERVIGQALAAESAEAEVVEESPPLLSATAEPAAEETAEETAQETAQETTEETAERNRRKRRRRKRKR